MRALKKKFVKTQVDKNSNEIGLFFKKKNVVLDVYWLLFAMEIERQSRK